MTDTRGLTAGQVADFERNGYVFVPSMFSAKQMSRITNWVEEVAGAPEEPGRM